MAPEEGAAAVCKPVCVEPRDGGGGEHGLQFPPSRQRVRPRIVDPALPRSVYVPLKARQAGGGRTACRTARCPPGEGHAMGWPEVPGEHGVFC